MVIEHNGCNGCRYEECAEGSYPCSSCACTKMPGTQEYRDAGDLWEPKGNAVVHPSHYNHGGVECIDAIRAALGEDGFRSFCKGNALKYIWRCDYKGELEDIKKAAYYLNIYISNCENEVEG